MPPKLPYQVGSQVEHAKFGLGAVTAINEDRLTIKWDDHGEKTFVTAIAIPQLKKSDREPLPDKKRTTRKSASASSTPKKSAKKKAKSEEVAPAEEVQK